MRVSAFRFSCARPTGRSTGLSMTVAGAIAPDVPEAGMGATSTSEALLHDSSFHIEFQGYLSNHVKHAIVALHGLHAPKGIISKYWDSYTAEVPYGWTLEPSHKPSGAPLTSEGYKKLLGRKEKFPELVAFFTDEMEKLGSKELLKKYVPQLIPGAAAALTHGIIHLGWAMDFGSRYMTVEGLAYMAYTFLSVHPERFQSSSLPETNPVDSIFRLSLDYADQKVAVDINTIKDAPEYSLASGWHPELYDAGFQWHLSKVLDRGHEIFLKLPEWLDTMPTSEALEGMYQAVVLLYLVSAGEPATTGNGNFVVLHLITALWGAEQVIKELPEELHSTALKCYWASAVSIVATTQQGFPPEETLRQVWDKFSDDYDPEDMRAGTRMYEDGGGLHSDDAHVPDADDTEAWDQIVQRAYDEEEEHNIKLVYVCRKLWKRYGHLKAFRVAASRFTLTPNVGPNASEFSA